LRAGEEVDQSMSEIWHRVAAVTEIPQGRMQGFEIDGYKLVVCNTREGWFALDDICTHAHARMHEGRLRGCRMICPLHGASFDARDGRALGAPASTPLQSYPIRITEIHVEVALPERA
jgi:3-phenylpropionate/trans-cinnamate dioxygenase ferredoxin subunit